MPPPAKIGRVGKVTITNRKGHRGPTTVELMSEYDFGRLETLIKAYVDLDSVQDQLDNHPNRQVRIQMSALLGLPAPAPCERAQSKKASFTRYKLKGLLNKSAVPNGSVDLEPKLIERATFTDVVAVAN